jgi:hypothetical protein
MFIVQLRAEELAKRAEFEKLVDAAARGMADIEEEKRIQAEKEERERVVSSSVLPSCFLLFSCPQDCPPWYLLYIFLRPTQAKVQKEKEDSQRLIAEGELKRQQEAEAFAKKARENEDQWKAAQEERRAAAEAKQAAQEAASSVRFPWRKSRQDLEAGFTRRPMPRLSQAYWWAFTDPSQPLPEAASLHYRLALSTVSKSLHLIRHGMIHTGKI